MESFNNLEFSVLWSPESHESSPFADEWIDEEQSMKKVISLKRKDGKKLYVAFFSSYMELSVTAMEYEDISEIRGMFWTFALCSINVYWQLTVMQVNVVLLIIIPTGVLKKFFDVFLCSIRKRFALLIFFKGLPKTHSIYFLKCPQLIVESLH